MYLVLCRAPLYCFRLKWKIIQHNPSVAPVYNKADLCPHNLLHIYSTLELVKLGQELMVYGVHVELPIALSVDVALV